MKSFLGTTHSGLAALMVVVIILAAATIMVVGAAYIGIDDLELGYTNTQASEAMAVADGCMEEAYRKLRLNPSYTGNASLSLGSGTCIIEVTADGDFRTSTVTSTVGSYKKKIRSALYYTNSTTLNITSWEELTD